MPIHKSLLVIIVFILLSFSTVYAPNSQDSSDEDFEAWMEEGNLKVDEVPDGTTGNVAEGTTIEDKGIMISGQTSVSNGEVDTESAKTDSGAEMEKVEGLKSDGSGGFAARYADFFSYMGYSASKASGIYGTPNHLTIEDADKIEFNDMELTDAHILSGNEKELSIISAGKVEGQGLYAEDIARSNLKFEDGLSNSKIISDKDNNTISFLDGELKVTVDKDDTVQLKKNKTSGKYDVSVDSENGTVEDYEGNVACADVSPGSRYRYQDGETNEHFGLYVPSSAESFKLCIKTYAFARSQRDAALGHKAPARLML